MLIISTELYTKDPICTPVNLPLEIVKRSPDPLDALDTEYIPERLFLLVSVIVTAPEDAE